MDFYIYFIRMMHEYLDYYKPLLGIICKKCKTPIHYMLLDWIDEELAAKLYIKHQKE